MDKIIDMINSLRIKHLSCEDSFYSCPKSEYGTWRDDADPNICECGADDHNSIVDELLSLLTETKQTKQTADEIINTQHPKYCIEKFDSYEGYCPKCGGNLFRSFTNEDKTLTRYCVNYCCEFHESEDSKFIKG